MSLAQVPLRVGDAFNHARRLCASGQYLDAEPYLRMVLRLQPKQFDAQHMLGLCLLQRGEFAQARKRLAEAVKIEPRASVGHTSLGQALRALNLKTEAITSFQRAVELDPSDFDALCACGDALEDAGQYEQALSMYERALALRPDAFAPTCARANCLLLLHRNEAAIAGFDRALELEPDSADALHNRSVAVTRIRPEEAIAGFDRLIPRCAPPFRARAISNRGNAYAELDRLDEALACHEQALQLEPGLFEAQFCRAASLHALNRLEEALGAYDAAIALNPGHADARMFRSMALLSMGRFDEGWTQYEWRGKGVRRLARPDRRRWSGGGDLSGRTVLLYHEQGNGDTIQFARYAKLLLSRGARVTLQVQEPLVSLLRGLDPGVRVVGSAEDPGPFDLRCPVMSLPLAFGTRGDTIPAPIPYLGAEAARVEHWRQVLASDRAPRIGLAWAGNAANINDRRRSAPLARLAPLRLPGLRFVVLQNELRAGDRELLSSWPEVERSDGDIRDFEDVAALIELCDLVVCVDTAVAHLAGAMGKPVWILLPFSPDFRWMLERADSPWYPSARLFRQPRTGDWETVVAEVAAQLRARFGIEARLP